MYRCGLGTRDFKTYLGALALPHSVIVSVELQTNEGKTLVSFDGGRAGNRDVVVTDGQVDVDSTTLVGRSLTLSVADPARLLIVDQDANYVDRMLQVKVGITVAELGKVVWAPVFTGPITGAPRSGDIIQFTAQGKARFGQHGIAHLYKIKKGTKKTVAIRRIMADLAGETPSHMTEIPDLPPVLAHDLILHITSRPYGVCVDLAASMDRHLAYNGNGDLRMQRFDLTNPVYTFHKSAKGPTLIDSPPESSTEWTTISNAVKVTGSASKAKTAPIGYAYADPNNDFSAEKLGRNDAGAYFWDLRDVNSLHTVKACERVARNVLNRDLAVSRSLKFEAMPIYVFDELDLVGVHTPGFIGQTRLSQYTIPLNIEQGPTMSFGFNKRVSSNSFARRR